MSKDRNSQVELARQAYFASRQAAQERCLDIFGQVFPELQMAQCHQALKCSNRLAFAYAGVLNKAGIVTPSSVQYGATSSACDFSFGAATSARRLILPPAFFKCIHARNETIKKATAELNSDFEATKQRS